MFTVKAEVQKDVGPNSFQLFQAASVRVAKSLTGQAHVLPPEIDVELFDADRRTTNTLCVGHGIDHYCAVYVMNERGKTVESVYPGPGKPA